MTLREQLSPRIEQWKIEVHQLQARLDALARLINSAELLINEEAGAPPQGAMSLKFEERVTPIQPVSVREAVDAVLKGGATTISALIEKIQANYPVQVKNLAHTVANVLSNGCKRGRYEKVARGTYKLKIQN